MLARHIGELRRHRVRIEQILILGVEALVVDVMRSGWIGRVLWIVIHVGNHAGGAEHDVMRAPLARERKPPIGIHPLQFDGVLIVRAGS